jgi:Protein of unknown function (DUF998)
MSPRPGIHRRYHPGVSWSRLRAACGIVGPAAFTAAWVVSTIRQERYSIRDEHISGLAAPDARDPWIMTVGFLALGVCTIAFADELDRRLRAERDAGLGPAFLGLAGLGALGAGTFRRDRMSNVSPPGAPPGQSLRNDLHDLSSTIGSAAGSIGLVLLALRFHERPEWEPVRPWALAVATAETAIAAYFARDVVRPGNGIVQRVGISLPLAFMATTALRMLRRPSASA